MSSLFFEARDARTSRLHTAMDAVERELGKLPATTPDEDAAGLRGAWTAFVKLLALDPVLELRECPTCHQVGMRAATRCGHCWDKLVPPATD